VQIAVAQPKPGYDPTSTHIFPAGGQRGTTVPVRVGTECAPPKTHFMITGAGLHASDTLGPELKFAGEPSPRRLPTEIPITYPREWSTEVTISADAPPGAVFWRLHGGAGGTASRPFVVGDLPEHVESESNSVPNRAEPVELPITLNGQINGERDVDYYRFSVAAGEVVSCEVVARRLGSPLDPLVALFKADGTRVSADETFVGNDPVTVFRATDGGEYLLRMANVSLHGSPACVYRVNLVQQPWVRYAFPPSGQAGREQSVALHAIGGDGTLVVLDATIAFPEDAGPFEYRHPDLAGSLMLASEPAPVVTESEANDTLDSAPEISFPALIDGRLMVAADQDWFRFTAKKSEAYTLTCEPFPRGGQCLPNLALTDAEGNELSVARSVEARDGICRLEWSPPANGQYGVRVRDLRHGAVGGADFIYRLRIGVAEPDFALRLAPDNINLSPGTSAEFEVKLQRYGKFVDPVELRFEGIPDGVSVESTSIAANTDSVKVKLTTTEDVRVGSSVIRLIGRAKVNDDMVERIALATHLGVDSEGVSVGSPTVDRCHLTIRHKPVFRLYCAEAYQYAHRGTVYPYLMDVERLDGFDGEVVLQIGDRQNRDLDSVEMIETIVPPKQSEIMMPIYLPETMHINVQSQSQLYTQGYAIFTDKHGEQQSVLVLAEKRNMIRTMPPVAKLETIDRRLEVEPGGTVTCRLRLERTSNFPDAVELELVAPMPAGITADPARIAAGQEEGEIAIRVSDNAACAEPITLKFRATGKLTPQMLVVSEDAAELSVRPGQPE
jgi:hypothetical protein